MATVTVPSGSGNSAAAASLNFNSASGASLAISLLSQVYAAHNAGTLNVYPSAPVAGGTNEFLIAPSVTGSVTVPAGYDTIVDTSTSAVTVTGNGDAGEVVAVGTNTTLDFIAGGGTGTVVGGGALVTVVSGGTGDFTIAGDSAAYAVAYLAQGDVTGASEVILTGTNAAVTASGSGATIFGSNAGADFITNTGGADTVEAGGGQTTISALAGGGYYADATGNLIFVNGGSGYSVVVGGSGSVAAFNGGGSGSYVAGSGLFLMVNGSGDATVTAGQGNAATGISAGLFDGDGGALTLTGGSPGGVNSFLISGAGSETLNAATSTSPVGFVASAGGTQLLTTSTSATDYVLAGSGATTVLGSGAQDIFVFVNGTAGGSDVFANWNPSDVMLFYGYGAGGTADIQGALATNATTQTSSGYVTSLVLPDSTRITFTSASPFQLSNNPAYFG